MSDLSFSAFLRLLRAFPDSLTDDELAALMAQLELIRVDRATAKKMAKATKIGRANCPVCFGGFKVKDGRLRPHQHCLRITIWRTGEPKPEITLCEGSGALVAFPVPKKLQQPAIWLDEAPYLKQGQARDA